MRRITDPALVAAFDQLVARRGLTLGAFAREAGVDRNTVLKFRQGRGVSPTILTRIRVAIDRLPELGAVPVVEVAS